VGPVAISLRGERRRGCMHASTRLSSTSESESTPTRKAPEVPIYFAPGPRFPRGRSHSRPNRELRIRPSLELETGKLHSVRVPSLITPRAVSRSKSAGDGDGAISAGFGPALPGSCQSWPAGPKSRLWAHAAGLTGARPVAGRARIGTGLELEGGFLIRRPLHPAATAAGVRVLPHPGHWQVGRVGPSQPERR
jgi:hypothetical protein